MASRRTNEQRMTWLKSKAAEKDSLDGINAQLVLNVIEEKDRRLEKLGAQFKNVKDNRDRLQETLYDFFINGKQLSEDEKQRIYDEYGIEMFNF